MHINRSLILGVLLGCLFVLPLATAAAQSDAAEEHPLITQARERYHADQWPEGERHAGLSLGNLEVPGLSGLPVDHWADDTLLRVYQDADEQPRLVVEAGIFETVAEAQTLQLRFLGFVQSVALMPTTASVDLAVGEVGHIAFAGEGQTRIAWIVFTCGNVTVRIMNTRPMAEDGPDMRAIAVAVDGLIRETATLEADAALPRPTVSTFTAETEACVAGDIVALNLAIADTVEDGALSVTFELAGTGSGFVRQTEDGAWELVTTGPGTITVTAIVTATTGTTARASLTLEAADDE